MAQTIPYSRTVNVTLTRNSRFPSRRGFGTQLVLTSTAVAGVVDAANRTKAYGSMDEVVADWATTTDFYKAALSAFSQNPRPLLIKAGYYDNATMTSNAIKAQLDLIYDADPSWYWLTTDTGLRDVAAADGVVEWVEGKNKLAVLDSNDVLLLDATDTTNIAARHKGTVERTAVFYHSDAAEFCAAAWVGVMSTFNFDQADSAYTGKYKKLRSVSAVNIGSGDLSELTGFTPDIGQSETVGHCANTYIDIGDQDFVVEGSTISQNVFVDELHASDWIIARTEEELLGILLNNNRIPFDDGGMQMLAAAPQTIMTTAARAGLIANDLNPETGEYEPAFEITVPSVFSVPESQRKNRIAPAIQVRFRYAGAVHYTTVNYNMTF